MCASQKIDEIARIQEGIAAEEAMILRGWVVTVILLSARHLKSWPLHAVFDPSSQPGNLDRDVLERLSASVKAVGDYCDPVSIYNCRIVISLMLAITQLTLDFLKLVSRNHCNCIRLTG